MHAAPYRLIPLRNREGTIVADALVDPRDFLWLLKWRWCLSQKGNTAYPVRGARVGEGRRPRRLVFMHREILGLSDADPREGDHINGNPLDCRRSNLRVATRRENAQNRECGTGRSGIRGVSWSKHRQRWTAWVKLDGRSRYLGYFDSREGAAAAAAAFRAQHMPFSAEARRASPD